MPLPKEIHSTSVDSKLHNPHHTNTNIATSNKSTKWSIGNFFRRKKKEELSDSSSEEDRKAGFNPAKRKVKPKAKQRNSKLIGAFDHIVVSPSEKSRDVPHIIHPNPSDISPIGASSTGSLDRRTRKDRSSIRLSNKLYPNEQHRSSEDDTHSFNSSSISHFRSDESLGGHSVSSSKRTRAARNERYLKRISRGEEPSAFVPMGQLAQRWQTQPISSYAHPTTTVSPHHQMPPPMADVRKHGSHPSLQSAYSWTSSNVTVHAPPSNIAQPQQRNPPWNSLLLNNNKYHISNDAAKRTSQSEDYINRRFTTAKEITQKGPPPPPPRDPQRRIAMQNGGQTESRPLSYAFDRNTVPVPSASINSRCVSDERLWGPRHLIPLPQRPSSVQPEPLRNLKYSVFKPPMRDPPASQPVTINHSSPKPEYKYIADAAPRSRRPIHILESIQPAAIQPQQQLPPASTDFSPPPKPQQPPVLRYNQNGLLSPMKSASSFWRKIDQAESTRRTEPEILKPRSAGIPSPTAKPKLIENRKYTLLNDVRKTKELAPEDELDTVVTGSLFIQPMKNCVFRTMPNNGTNTGSKYNESTTSVLERIKSNSMPGYYSQQQRQVQSVPLNKYEEHVAKNISQPTSPFVYNPVRPPPVPPLRRTTTSSATTSKRNSFIEEEARRKSTNLEDAINELEAIYASLRLGDEDLLDRADRRDLPTPPTKFKRLLALSPEHDEDEDDTNTGEPDIVLDDVVYRNLKRAKSIPKTNESQPPFGIPIGPIPPSPGTDYLHVSPSNPISKPMFVSRKCPDIVADDLAVRNLRKDNGCGVVNQSIVAAQQDTRGKKMRATRTMSENIYNLIQRDAAKPSGGCLDDYAALERSLSKARSLKNVNEDDGSNLLLVLQRNAKLSPTSKQSLSPSSRRTTPDSKIGGAVFNLPSTLSASPTSVPIVNTNKTPVPLPRSTSHTSDDMANGIEEMLNAIAREAKESSEKLSRDLIELQREIKSKSNSRTNLAKLKMEDEIDDAAKAAQRCKDILSDVVAADNCESTTTTVHAPASPRRLRKEKKLLGEINDVANAAKLCESVLESVCAKPLVKPKDKPVAEETSIATLLEKLEPESRKIGAIAERCMRQLSELGDLHTKIVAKNAKPSVSPSVFEQSLRAIGCDRKPAAGHDANEELLKREKTAAALFEKPPSGGTNEKHDSPMRKLSVNEQIEKMMKECAEEANKSDSKHVSSEEELNILLLPPTPGQIVTETKLSRLSSSMDEAPNKSSSDCLNSSSATPNCANSSNLSSYNTQSSSDYVKSPSSEYHIPSEEVKTCSTTSNYAKSSSSSTPPMHSANTSPASPSPPPPPSSSLQAIGATDAGGSESQYNSSEELAMIFGIKSTTPPPSGPATMTTGNDHTPADDASIAAAITNVSEHGMKSNCLLPSSPPPPYWDCRPISFDSLDTIIEAPHEDCCSNTTTDDTFNFASDLSLNCDDNDGTDDDCAGDDNEIASGFNSLTSVGESSPDSGNVSLNEYPLINKAQSCCEFLSSLPIDGEKYPFVSELQIGSNDAVSPAEKPKSEMILSSVEFELNYKTEVSIPISSGEKRTVSNSNSKDNDSILQRADAAETSSLRLRTTSPVPSTSRQLIVPHSIKETIVEERPSFIQKQHVLLACTLCLANNDLLTLAAIIIAILTIIALFVL